MRERAREQGQEHERDGFLARGRVIGEHLREIVRLEGKLALVEIGRGIAWLVAGITAFALAAVFTFFILALLVGAAVAGVAEALPIWASLLIIAGALALLALAVVALGVFALKRGVPMPKRAIKEMRKTAKAIRGGNGHG